MDSCAPSSKQRKVNVRALINPLCRRTGIALKMGRLSIQNGKCRKYLPLENFNETDAPGDISSPDHTTDGAVSTPAVANRPSGLPPVQPPPCLGIVPPGLNIFPNFFQLPNRDRDAPISTELSQLYKEIRRFRRRLADQERFQRGILHDLRNSQQLASALSHQLHVQSLQLQHIRTALAQAEAERDATRRLLVERTAELDGAQVFLNQADNVSGADAIAIAEALNAEILQNAAFMADSLEDSLPSLNSSSPYPNSPRLNSDGESAVRTMHKTSLIAGEALARSLHSKHGSNFDANQVQYAFQVGLVKSCCYIVGLWIPRNREHDALFQTIYSSIRKTGTFSLPPAFLNKPKTSPSTSTESPSVAGRWRAITRSHLKENKDLTDHTPSRMSDELVPIVVAASSCSQQRAKRFLETFHERFSVLARLAIRLNVAIGQEITSMNIFPYAVPCGDSFDPRFMEDVYADRNEENQGAGRKLDERVAGTIDLGLYIDKAPGSDVLSKAKVILCSALK